MEPQIRSPPRDPSPVPSSANVEQPTPRPPKTRPAPRGTASYQRKRAVRACQVCRARRTKCDNLKPSCSFCLKVGATCIQSPVDLSSFDPASLKILERLDDLEELMRSTSLSRDELPHKTRVVEASQSSPDRPDVNSPEKVDVRESTSTEFGAGMVIPPPPDQIVGWEVFRHILGPEREYGALPHPDQTVVSAISPVSTMGILDMEPRRVNELLDSFFSYVHVKNPILDETATRHMVLSTIMNGIDWSPESCLALLICALGSLSTPFGPSPDTMPGTTAYANAMTFFQAAQKRLGILISSDEIIAPQCLFLAGVFMMCVFQPVKAWRYFLQALAGCQQLSFLAPETQERYHGISDGGHPHDHAIDTLQQAIYWSAWKSERELRSDTHRPDFFLDDVSLIIYPPFFPTPPAPRAEPDTSTDPRREREQTSWYFYLAEISLRRLAARMSAGILELHAQHKSQQAFLEAMAAAVPEYEEQVHAWTSSLPPNLSFDAPPEHDDVCRFVLRGHAINLYENIYWPFISAYLTCEDLSRGFASFSPSIIHYAERSLHYHFVRLTANRPGFRHRHHGTNPLMRSCSRSAMVLLAASIKGEMTRAQGTDRGGAMLTIPQGWQQEIDEVIDLIDYWGNETRDFGKIRTVLDQGRMPPGGPTGWDYAPQTYM